MLQIIKSPSQYIQGSGLLGQLESFLKPQEVQRVYLLVDPFISEHYADTLRESFPTLPTLTAVFGGECSREEVNAHMAALSDCDIIVGIGGGKTLDTAKAIGYYAHIPTVVVPTIASTDAPCSALSVLYTPEGVFSEYLFLKASPLMVIMDTDLIVKAPARLFVAGMGDALATYFEADTTAASGSKTIAGGYASQTALTLARLCYDTLLSQGYLALSAVEQQVCTPAVERIIEANTYLSGIGFESGGLAAAHAIHNGLTVLEECHHMYHGEKVAFGTIVQLVLENRSLEQIAEVVQFCRSVGLPTCLADLGATSVTDEQLMAVAEASVAPGETIHNSVHPITAQDVFAALKTADSLGSQVE